MRSFVSLVVASGVWMVGMAGAWAQPANPWGAPGGPAGEKPPATRLFVEPSLLVSRSVETDQQKSEVDLEYGTVTIETPEQEISQTAFGFTWPVRVGIETLVGESLVLGGWMSFWTLSREHTNKDDDEEDLSSETVAMLVPYLGTRLSVGTSTLLSLQAGAGLFYFASTDEEKASGSTEYEEETSSTGFTVAGAALLHFLIGRSASIDAGLRVQYIMEKTFDVETRIADFEDTTFSHSYEEGPETLIYGSLGLSAWF
jgi:hypothetical protein